MSTTPSRGSPAYRAPSARISAVQRVTYSELFQSGMNADLPFGDVRDQPFDRAATYSGTCFPPSSVLRLITPNENRPPRTPARASSRSIDENSYLPSDGSSSRHV